MTDQGDQLHLPITPSGPPPAPINVPGDWQGPRFSARTWWCAICGVYGPIGADGLCVWASACVTRVTCEILRRKG